MNRVLTKYIILAVALLMGSAATAQSVSGVVVGGNVFGGGNQANVKGSSSVTVKQTGTDVNGLLPPTIQGDIYGGGALASVNVTATVGPETTTYSHTPGTTTTVEITHGTINGNVYGGGLGDDTHAAAVYGEVTVNIGKLTGDLDNGFAPSDRVYGYATLNGSVFGCNNANGTPKDNVTVNIYKTAHTSGDDGNTVDGTGFAIHEVFGGGNQAHYVPVTDNKKTTVHVWTCDNTIEYVYGGGNAADVGTLDADPEEAGNQTITANTSVIIDGGRHEWVFGGGNGAGDDNPGANIFGDASSTFHSGKVTYFFGGSNERGTITGSKTVSVPNDGPCTGNYITELYGGNNLADAVGDITLTMPCSSNPCRIEYIFGGSRQANVTGNVTLNIEGGNYGYVFGGNNLGGTITGDVTLNLYGGSIEHAAFGGNKGGGSITGDITVNVEDHCSCPLEVKDVFGAGDQAKYEAPEGEGAREFNPMVNIKNVVCDNNGHTITGNVYGGGNGNPEVSSQEPGMVTGKPLVTIGDEGHADYVAAISGNVYGGGNAAKVVGNTTVVLQKANSVVDYNIFGGGNLAMVTGPTSVTVRGGRVYSVYGGGALAGTGPTTVDILAGTIEGNVYGGCLGGEYNNTIYYPAVDGTTTVNIGSGTVDPDTGLSTSTSGSATFLGGSVYGGNDAYGSPTGNATVNIYQTAHIEDDGNYAIAGVFGGGNVADFEGPNTYVNVYGCDNTIERVFGGSNAASAEIVNTMIQGGRIGQVFGGGNGYISSSDEADIHGDVNLDIHGGTIQEVYGGGNEVGTITGAISLKVDKTSACNMIIRDVYGGGNKAANAAGTITIGCTGSLVSGENGHAAHPENIGITLEGIGTVYGGANQAGINGNIKLDINSGIVANVFGGNNNSGAISGTVKVNINKNSDACDWYVGDVYGGGNHAAYSGSPDVNIIAGTVSGNVYGGGNDITTANAGILNSDVEMTGGTVLGGIYGGCNLNGTVTGISVVNILGGVIGSQALLDAGTTADVFGGGLGENTQVNGNVTVTISRASGNDAPDPPTIYGDVYGGSALGNVNTDGSNTTTVNIFDGILKSNPEQCLIPGTTDRYYYIYHGGNVYGGGLGRKEDLEHSVTAVEAKVFGAVTVNIGSGTPGDEEDGGNFTGNATIEGNVYGCNNTNGSPQDYVTVKIYRTAHTTTDEYDYDPELHDNIPATFAIANVFGGGNEANYTASDKMAKVYIYGCFNTIERVFGGGNAAATPSVKTDIQGGRFFQVFGGGNGERGSQYAADIDGDLTLSIHGGNVGQFYGISNQNGNVSGTATVNTDNSGPCDEMMIDEFFCGGNYADITGDLITTISCSEGMMVNSLYGGCNQADIKGNVVLNVEGGFFANVYGGSKGVAGGISADILDNPDTSEKEGNITLNLYGGTIGNVFGGSNINGRIDGIITVNVIDDEEDCPLYITNIYGGSNETDYTPTYTPVAPETERITPVVNVVHAKNGISGNVYGGSKGKENVEPPTAVNSSPLVNIGYNSDMNAYLPSTYLTFISNTLNNKPRAIVAGDVYGGGDAATVNGNTVIFLRNRAKVFGNVYGGGNNGAVKDNPDTTEVVEGNTKVIVNGDNE